MLPITLATMGAQVVGTDLLDYEFEHPNFSFRKGDFLDAEFPTAHFDAVVAISSVEHVGLGSYGSPRYDKGDVSVVWTGTEFGVVWSEKSFGAGSRS